MDTERDRWAEWLLHRRHRGDPEALRRVLEFLYPVRDRVLDNAAVASGETVLDVGCGDGLIAFGALGRVGENGHVVFSDVSQDLLDYAHALAESVGVTDRCGFVRAAAEELSAIPDASVDVVTTRSVLIYVADKGRAFREFFRVLRPGGRLSIFEPINRFGAEARVYDAEPVSDLADRVSAVFESLQPIVSDPMMNFDERDLLALAEEAGFRRITLELRAEIAPTEPRPWDEVMGTAGNPNIPSWEEAMRQALNPEEQRRYAAHFRPLVEGGRGIRRSATAYLWAVKESNESEQSLPALDSAR